jgi:sensor domain DACNV-containing protein
MADLDKPTVTSHSRRPEDLAEVVYSEVAKRSSRCPSKAALVDLFGCLYFASLRTEEGEPITIHVVYLDPSNPDPKPPKRIRKDRWSYIRLAKTVRMTVPNLVKIAKASDPRSSSFAVHRDSSGHLFIWGLIDQGNRYHDFVNRESESGPERPGVFQASIAGVGHLVAYIDYDKIAELKINTLVRSESDVLAGGPVREKLEPGIRGYLADVRSALPGSMRREFSDWVDGLSDDWVSSICRLLLRVKNYGHGGALLITPDRSLRGLNVKYEIKYRRLRTALANQAVFRIKEMYASDLIFGQYIEQDADDIPMGLYFDETINEDDFEDSRSELEGAIWFVSLLTRVDGLVLMKPGLDVDGFGVEITYQEKPTTVFRTRDRLARERHLHRASYERFGTRHRSMMRYCNETPGAVGFVISQDGDVRVITQVKGRLVMWENVRLQLLEFIRHRKTRKIIS